MDSYLKGRDSNLFEGFIGYKNNLLRYMCVVVIDSSKSLDECNRFLIESNAPIPVQFIKVFLSS